MQHLLQAEAGVQYPFPGQAGDDEGQRHRIQVDGAQRAFGADFLVQQDGQEQADGDAATDEQDTEDAEVLERGPPALVVEQLDVLHQAGELVVRHQPRFGQRQPTGQKDKTIDEYQAGDERGAQHHLRYPSVELLAYGHRRAVERTACGAGLVEARADACDACNAAGAGERAGAVVITSLLPLWPGLQPRLSSSCWCS
ncbi:hypothetical protein D3C72_1460380 [compost metagenome]